jgi:hypothetical protein
VVVPPKPPVVIDPTTPVINVELEKAKEIISDISGATRVTSGPVKSANPDASTSAGLIGDFRMLNLGIKLPDDQLAEDSSTN